MSSELSILAQFRSHRKRLNACLGIRDVVADRRYLWRAFTGAEAISLQIAFFSFGLQRLSKE
jgi:hypothetical protein